MTLYQLAKLLTVAFSLTCTYTGNVLQFIQCHRINGCHGFQWRILENYIRWYFQFLGKLLTQILQHGIKSRIDSARATAPCRSFFFHFFEIIIFGYLERFRMFQELLSFIRYFQQTVIFHIFTQVTSNECLANDSIPCSVFFSHAGAESFQVFMQMRLHFGSFTSLYNVDDIICLKIFFHRENSLYHGTQ